MSLELIHRLLEAPTQRAIDALLGASCVFAVDRRGYDHETVLACARCIDRAGSLTAEWDPGLHIHYNGRSVEVPLTDGVADRYITIVTLSSLLSPDYEVRFCIDSMGGDTLAFIVLPSSEWQLLERRWGAALETRFYRLSEEPNLFTHAPPFQKPTVIPPPPSATPGWSALVDAASEAPSIVETLPENRGCAADTDLVLDQVARGAIDIERLRTVAEEVPEADRPLVRMVLALRDGDPVQVARALESATLVLDALRYLPQASARRTEAVLCAAQTLAERPEAPGTDTLAALDRALDSVLTRKHFATLAPELRQHIRSFINDYYARIARTDNARFRWGRWAPLCITRVGDESSLALLNRHTRDVPELDDCPARRARWQLDLLLDKERLHTPDAPEAPAASPPSSPPPAPAAPIRVRHRKFGEGEIIATLEGDKVEVRFGEQTKRLIRSVLEVLEP